MTASKFEIFKTLFNQSLGDISFASIRRLAPFHFGESSLIVSGFMPKGRIVSLRKIYCGSSMDGAGSLRSSASLGGIRMEALKEVCSRPIFRALNFPAVGQQ